MVEVGSLFLAREARALGVTFFLSAFPPVIYPFLSGLPPISSEHILKSYPILSALPHSTIAIIVDKIKFLSALPPILSEYLPTKAISYPVCSSLQSHSYHS